MQAAADSAFSCGARRVVIIGMDCPSLDEPALAEAFESLTRTDVVFGPAADGGYYLLGLSKPCPRVFTGIDWGTACVLEQSLVAARVSCPIPRLLGLREDVDLPGDLPMAEMALAAGESVSIIIPTLNEEGHLPILLEQLKCEQPHEIIIADGGSTDSTLDIARQAGVRVVNAPKGRASQMNLGASAATGEFLLFLHADTLPPSDFQQVVRRVLHSPGTSSGAFRFALAGEMRTSPIIEHLVNLRCRWLKTPYGDQGLFLRRRMFEHAGGFPDWPVMEDLHMVRALSRFGRVLISSEAARTSPRRWQRGGTLRTFLSHQVMFAAFHLGIPPRLINRLRT